MIYRTSITTEGAEGHSHIPPPPKNCVPSRNFLWEGGFRYEVSFLSDDRYYWINDFFSPSGGRDYSTVTVLRLRSHPAVIAGYTVFY